MLIRSAGIAVLSVAAYVYVPRWYALTPGGQAGANALDTSRQEILDRFDAFYAGATEWGTPQQPTHDEANNKIATERYFTLITDFFEYGWGDAFHMAPLKPGWSFERSMAEVEKHFSMLIGMKPGMRVADLGMGVGGPMRRLVEFTGAFIEGVTICKYQIARALKVTSTLPEWNQARLKYTTGDYNELPASMGNESFDTVYFMESLSHAEDRTPPLAEARRIVKPGHLVGAWQWMLKPDFNYSDPVHMHLKRGMEYGGSLRNLNKAEGDAGATTQQGVYGRHGEWNRAGLEVLMSYDMGEDFVKRGWVGWWVAISQGHDLPSMLTSSYYGRRLTQFTVKILELVGIAEPGTLRTAKMLEQCALAASDAGQMNIFTPAWVTIGIKPRSGVVNQGPIATSPEEFAKILAAHPDFQTTG